MSTSNTKLCPYCSEEILETAIKCKHCGSMLTNDPSLIDHTRPETFIKLALSNKYELLEEIGHGGMAIVYKARQKNLNRIVAIKILPQQFTHDKEFLERIHRKAKIAVSKDHPKIVTLYDEGQYRGIQVGLSSSFKMYFNNRW
jgi:serine/threonine protein kinase